MERDGRPGFNVKMMPSLKARPDAEPRYFKTFKTGLNLGMGSGLGLNNGRKP